MFFVSLHFLDSFTASLYYKYARKNAIRHNPGLCHPQLSPNHLQKRQPFYSNFEKAFFGNNRKWAVCRFSRQLAIQTQRDSEIWKDLRKGLHLDWRKDHHRKNRRKCMILIFRINIMISKWKSWSEKSRVWFFGSKFWFQNKNIKLL